MIQSSRLVSGEDHTYNILASSKVEARDQEPLKRWQFVKSYCIGHQLYIATAYGCCLGVERLFFSQ